MIREVFNFEKGMIIFLFVAVFLLLIFKVIPDFSEQEFRITKQVCENASIILGEREFNFISPWTYIQPRVMEADTKWHCNYLLGTNFGIYKEEIIDCEYTLINTSCVNISKQVKLYDNSTYLLDGYEEEYCEYQYLIESTTEVRGEQYFICHKEEVDEIKTNKGELNISNYITGEISRIPGCAYRINDTYVICLETISKQDLTIDWLDKNCECKVDRECSVHYNRSQVNRKWVDTGSGTYNGPIEITKEGSLLYFEPGAQVVEECTPCDEYLCRDYFVEVIR